jgi:hypothetical protein
MHLKNLNKDEWYNNDGLVHQVLVNLKIAAVDWGWYIMTYLKNTSWTSLRRFEQRPFDLRREVSYDCLVIVATYTLTQIVKFKDAATTSGAASSIIGGGGANIHIFGFCIINFFWNRLFLWPVTTQIYEYSPPPIIELVAPLATTCILK